MTFVYVRIICGDVGGGGAVLPVSCSVVVGLVVFFCCCLDGTVEQLGGRRHNSAAGVGGVTRGARESLHCWAGEFGTLAEM